ncbi:putative ABC transport system substrate-binding protein [Enterococcus sp. PF1-24]|uniref:tryptophan ABC transporter substrate-binding protein n=1 Tax=unclassified Enterococcus TaxID=2608891 RepID=UPI0024753DA3|nr:MULTISPECIES: tryptophan ABC transporter substrate-binding protein [unclassified Enterococcus]MDH6364163.1 putative ABC transport system substrate-binding protein [Enterococcus sp. PFB1-1]MDH6401264.1 putative ABC transport system substrate-binding protein [Enterococcus sp. PF1-24]
MKNNRRLILAVIIIFGILIGSFVKEVTTTTTTKDSETEEVLKVGILQYVSHEALDQISEGVVEGLAERGYVEGENLEIIFYNGQGDQSKLATMSQQLIDKKCDVLVGVATPAAQSLANATSSIPIIMAAITDPIKADLVQSLEEPGGNITGLSNRPSVEDQFALAAELLPKAKKIGILYSSAEDNSKSQVESATVAATALGLEVSEYVVNSTNEIAQTVEVMAEKADYIYLPQDNMIATAMPTVVAEANKSMTPIVTSVDTMVEAGGLVSIGQNQKDLGFESGKMVADALDGRKPATTPVYIYTKVEAVINMQQAEFLGIEIPEKVLAEAKLINE